MTLKSATVYLTHYYKKDVDSSWEKVKTFLKENKILYQIRDITKKEKDGIITSIHGCDGTNMVNKVIYVIGEESSLKSLAFFGIKDGALMYMSRNSEEMELLNKV